MKTTLIKMLELFIFTLTGIFMFVDHSWAAESCVDGQDGCLFGWNQEGTNGTDWPGWTYSTNVDGYNSKGWKLDSGQIYSGQPFPRCNEKTDYGSRVKFELTTTDRAPTSSSGAVLKASDIKTVHAPGVWWFYLDNMGDRGMADATTNRFSMYMKVAGIDDPLLKTTEPDNYNINLGTYLCYGNYCLPDYGTGQEYPGEHYYHQLVVNQGAWLHIQFDRHPQHKRDVGPPGVDPWTGHPYYQYFGKFYVEITPPHISSATLMLDDLRVYTETQAENEISIASPWIGYWPATGKWQVGFKDTSWGSEPEGKWSKFEVRWSLNPITNTNWASANTIVPEYWRYGSTNSFRGMNDWKSVRWTQFDLPENAEIENDKIYFAIKDTSLIVDGDGHNAPTTNIRTIDYDIRPESGSDTTAPRSPGGLSVR